MDSDLWLLDDRNQSDHIVPRLHSEWDKELRKCHRQVQANALLYSLDTDRAQ